MTAAPSDGPVRVSVDVSAVPDNPAGAGRYVVELVRTLVPRDDVELVLTSRGRDGARWRALAPGAPVLARAPANRPLRLAWEQVVLPTLVDRAGADVHHGPHYTMPERARAPKVVTVHDLTFFDHPEWHERPKVPVFRRAVRVAATHAQAVVCVSRVTGARLEALLSPRAPVHVIPHGVDHGRFRPLDPDDREGAERDRRIRERLGARSPYVVFVGTLEPRKDVPTLVRAFHRLAGRHRQLTLVVAGGEGWGVRDVEAAVRSGSHGDRVLRPGYVGGDDVPALLRGAAVAAYPSLAEGFGLPALEALACGTPLVTTEGTAMEEVAGEAALLVPPGHVDALAAALEAVLEGDPDVEARRRLGLSVASAYTWEASAAAHAAVYRSAVG